MPYLPSNFNPSTSAGANQVTQMVMEQVWPQSVVIDPQFNAVTSTSVASAELISISPQTVEYKIDPSAVWSDGVSITASDFVYNWHEQVANAGSLPLGGVLAGYKDIASITSSNKGRLVTVVFNHPYADWEGLFTNLVPAHVASTIGWNGFDISNVAEIVSAGPFEISSFVPDQELVLVRNKRWWGPTARLDRIVFRVVRGDAAVWSALEKGTVDAGEVATGPGVATQAAANGLVAATSISPVLWQLCFNLSDSVVGHQIVRKAVALSLDRVQLVDDTVGLIDPGMPVAQNRLFTVSAPGADTSAKQFSSVNLDLATRLLNLAGYTMSPSGFFEDGGGSPLVLTITAPSGLPMIAALEAEIQAELQQAGITVEFSNIPMSQLLGSVLPSSTYELALAPYYTPVYQSWTESVYGAPSAAGVGGPGSGSSKGRTQIALQPGGASGTGSPNAASAPISASAGFVTSNVSGLQDKAINVLYNQASAQLDLPTAHGLYNEINTLLWSDLPTIPLFDQPVTLVTASDLINVAESPTWAGIMWDAVNWGFAENLPKATTTSG